MGGPLIGPALNGGKASDWLRPIPCQREGDKLPKGAYQSGNGYSTRVHLPGDLACDPSSRREASQVSSQGKEASLSHMTLSPSSLKHPRFIIKIEKHIYNNHRRINKHRCLKGGQIETPPL